MQRNPLWRSCSVIRLAPPEGALCAGMNYSLLYCTVCHFLQCGCVHVCVFPPLQKRLEFCQEYVLLRGRESERGEEGNRKSFTHKCGHTRAIHGNMYVSPICVRMCVCVYSFCLLEKMLIEFCLKGTTCFKYMRGCVRVFLCVVLTWSEDYHRSNYLFSQKFMYVGLLIHFSIIYY